VGFAGAGSVTYLAGSRTNIAAGVAYYGGGIATMLEPKHRAARCCFTSASTMHTFRSPTSRRIRAAFPQGEYHLYDAGHGFNCTDRSSYDAAAAHLAWGRTLEFFRKYLG
jgi:carboxymethylenebutenolidase